MKPDLKNSGKDKKPRGRGLLWFVAGGIVTLILIVAFPAIHNAVKNLGHATVEQAKSLQKRIAKAPAAASSKGEPVFDFYEILTHPTQILTSEESDEVKSTTDSRMPVNQPGHYILQVASVKDAGSAQKLKAQLALWGIHAHVQTVDVQGETWHRIRVGPIADLGKLNTLRKQLDEHHLQPLLIRVDP